MAAQGLTPAPSLPRGGREGTRLADREGRPGGGSAPESLTHAGAPRGEAGALLLLRLLALAAGGGRCAPFLRLRSSDGAGRCLHLPAALLGLSRLRRPRGRGGGGYRPRPCAPACPGRGLPTPAAPAAGRDPPVLLRRWVRPGAPADLGAGPLLSSKPAARERDPD